MPLLLIIFIFRGLHFHLYSYLWCAYVITNILGPKTVMVHSFLGSEPRKAIRVMRFGQTRSIHLCLHISLGPESFCFEKKR